MFRGPEHSRSSLFLATSPGCVVQISGQLGTQMEGPMEKALGENKARQTVMAQCSMLPRNREQVETAPISTSQISAGEEEG